MLYLRSSIVIFLTLAVLAIRGSVAAAGECDASTQEHYFPEMQKCVSAIFYQYWQNNGGLAQ